jgi:hypothetical protein
MKKDHTNATRLVALYLAILVWAIPAEAKRKDDVVILKNGDRLTGEIKGLQRGELKFKADYMADSVRLDWSKVERLETRDNYLIFLADGTLFTDSIQLVSGKTPDSRSFIIGAGNAVKVEQIDVVRILPLEESFWQQLEGRIDFGFSFTSGNDQYQTELTASTTYRKGTHSITASVDSVFSGQSEGTSTARKEFMLDYRKQLSSRWYVGGLLDLLSSDQQNLDLRTTVGGLLGRSLMQTERTRFSVFGGLAANRERYSAILSQPRTTNADAIAGFDFTTFRFKTTDISTRFILYPSLSTPGRMRMQTTSDLRIEVAKDLYWGFHLYENFDSKPPVRADKNDLGISTSLGWKF